MLVLGREKDQTIRIGEDIVITIVKGSHVKIGIDAPRSHKIIRGELVTNIELPNHGKRE